MFDHTTSKVYFRDEFMDFKDANISIANTALLYGLAVFTGMRAHYNEETDKLFVFRPQDHYKRLYNGCKMTQMNEFIKNYSYDRFLSILKEILKTNNIKEDVYMRVSNMIDEVAIGPKFGKYKDTFYVYLYPLGNYVPTGGMKCMTSSFRRVDDNAIAPRAKLNGSYVNTAFAKSEALDNGFDEAIVLDNNGHAVEGSAENLFIVRDGNLITPPVSDNILEGITRASVIQIAKDMGIDVIERSIDRTEMYFADEVFLTGTGAKVSPVTQIDRIEVGNGQVGEISQKIQDIYFDIVKGKVEKYMNWVVEV